MTSVRYCHHKRGTSGNPLEPMLFSLSIQPLLVDLQKIFPSVCVLAYLDDVFVLESLEIASSALVHLQSSSSQIGLLISLPKRELYLNGQSCENCKEVSRSLCMVQLFCVLQLGRSTMLLVLCLLKTGGLFVNSSLL